MDAVGYEAASDPASVTFGEYLEAFVDNPGISHLTAEDYRRKVLTLVFEVVGIRTPPKKAKLARLKRWRESVESVRISDLSEAQFTNWRNGCLDAIGRGRKCGPLKGRSPAVTVNGLIGA